MILGRAKTPAIKQTLSHILVELQKDPAIITAVLASDDGLIIAANDEKDMHLVAAATSSIMTAVHQSTHMIGLADLEAVTIQLTNQQIMVCHSFWVGHIELILTIIFNQEIAYKPLFGQTIQAIRQAVEI